MRATLGIHGVVFSVQLELKGAAAEDAYLIETY